MKIRSITTIANIDPCEVSEGLREKLEEFARYLDNKEVYDMYNSWDLLNDEDLDTSIFTPEEMAEIKEIEEVCQFNECEYFRIID